MKYAPYSYSKLSTYDQCARKFKYKYIDKIPEGDSDKTAIYKGRVVHTILEKFPQIYNKDYLNSQAIAHNFIGSDLGQKYLNNNTLSTAIREIQIKLESVYFDGLKYFVARPETKRSDLTFYGNIDYVNVIDGVLNIIDWKTGNYVELKYQSFDQLMLYALYFFIREESIQQIRISYVYVEHLLENDLVLERKYLDNYLSRLNNLIESAEGDEYNKNISRLCDWCPFKSVCDKDS